MQNLSPVDIGFSHFGHFNSIIRDIDKINIFLRKKKFIEKYFDQKFRGFFIASGTELTRDQLVDIDILLRKNHCELLNL